MFLKAAAKYMNFRPFTDAEAWAIFRLAAFGEAIGWSLLIIGVWCQRLPVWWHDYPVDIAGRIHGTLFLLYLASVLVLSPSLGWRWKQSIIAAVCSVPPFGTLIYEQVIARWRSYDEFNTLLLTLRYASVVNA